MAWVRSYTATASATSVTVTITVAPSAINTMLIANVVYDQSLTMTTPADWNHLVTESQAGTNTHKNSTYWKVATGSETSVVFNASGSAKLSAAYSEFSDSDGTVYGTNQTGSAVDAAAITSTALTSVPSGAVNVVCFGCANAATSNSTTITGTNWTERADIMASGGGNRRGAAHATNAVDSGTVNTCTSTWNGTCNSLSAISFYLQPRVNIGTPLLMAM